jgi:hypothetical protein
MSLRGVGNKAHPRWGRGGGLVYLLMSLTGENMNKGENVIYKKGKRKDTWKIEIKRVK